MDKFRRCLKRTWFFLLLVGTTVFNSSAQYVEASSISPLINEYHSDKAMLNRKYALKYSTEYLLRMELYYTAFLKKLESRPFAKLSKGEQVDYLLLKKTIQTDALLNKEDKTRFDANQRAISFLSPLMEFEQARRIGRQPDPEKSHMTFQKLQEALENACVQLKQNQLNVSPLQAHWAVQAVGQYQSVFTEAYKFYEGYDPQFTAATKGSFPKLIIALKEYTTALTAIAAPSVAKDDGSGILGNPIGKEALLRSLQHEMIAYSPEEIEAIALREFAWCDAEMLKASREMGFGDQWKQALEKVKNAYPELGKQPELVYELANEAITFVEKNRLIRIPELAKEGWRMRMLTPQEQLFAPFFLGGESVLIAYPTTDMSAEAQQMTLRGNNRHFSRAVVFHELIPGHNLQYFMQSRYKTYRRSFSTPFWTEGWALYWEMLLWDQQFPKSPEDKIGMLFWRMHRCARIIFSMNYHLGKWTPRQCIDFLVDRVGFERANAEAEVRRSFTGGYGPLYQIGYMIGGLQFRALHQELVGSGKMTSIDFHDRILKENCMPVEMVRALLIEQPLSSDFQTKWKFAGIVSK